MNRRKRTLRSSTGIPAKQPKIYEVMGNSSSIKCCRKKSREPTYEAFVVEAGGSSSDTSTYVQAKTKDIAEDITESSSSKDDSRSHRQKNKKDRGPKAKVKSQKGGAAKKRRETTRSGTDSMSSDSEVRSDDVVPKQVAIKEVKMKTSECPPKQTALKVQINDDDKNEHLSTENQTELTVDPQMNTQSEPNQNVENGITKVVVETTEACPADKVTSQSSDNNPVKIKAAENTEHVPNNTEGVQNTETSQSHKQAVVVSSDNDAVTKQTADTSNSKMTQGKKRSSLDDPESVKKKIMLDTNTGDGDQLVNHTKEQDITSEEVVTSELAEEKKKEFKVCTGQVEGQKKERGGEDETDSNTSDIIQITSQSPQVVTAELESGEADDIEELKEDVVTKDDLDDSEISPVNETSVQTLAVTVDESELKIDTEQTIEYSLPDKSSTVDEESNIGIDEDEEAQPLVRGEDITDDDDTDHWEDTQEEVDSNIREEREKNNEEEHLLSDEDKRDEKEEEDTDDDDDDDGGGGGSGEYSEGEGWGRAWNSLFAQSRHQPKKRPRLVTHWSSQDTKEYRDGYPGKKDNHRLNDNLRFYKNEIPSAPNGDYIDNIHEYWWGDYSRLERHHGFIQWIFPIRESGMNYQAQVLQLHEAEAIREDKKASERVLKSYKMMLDFYGMKLVNDKTGKLGRSGSWKDRYGNLNLSSHNYLRITRILKSLGEFGYEHLKTPFVDFVLREILEEEELQNCLNSCTQYWLHVIKSESDRKKLVKYINRHFKKEKSK
ncbi:uncharacterized protein LOC144434030 [Glandiceps talaboti]